MIIKIIDLDFININFYMYLSKCNIKHGTASYNSVSRQNVFPDITSIINIFIGIPKSDSTKVFCNKSTYV